MYIYIDLWADELCCTLRDVARKDFKENSHDLFVVEYIPSFQCEPGQLISVPLDAYSYLVEAEHGTVRLDDAICRCVRAD